MVWRFPAPSLVAVFQHTHACVTMPSRNASGSVTQPFIDMKNIVSVLVFTFLFSLPAQAQTAGKITGTVYLGNENTVLHQVSVQIVELKLKTITDTAGSYVFANVPPGKYTITAHQE